MQWRGSFLKYDFMNVHLGVTSINFRYERIFKYIYIQKTIQMNIQIYSYQTYEYPNILTKLHEFEFNLTLSLSQNEWSGLVWSDSLIRQELLTEQLPEPSEVLVFYGWHGFEAYILKVGLAGWKMILNFPQKDYLRMRKVSR